eukprot:810882_1
MEQVMPRKSKVKGLIYRKHIKKRHSGNKMTLGVSCYINQDEQYVSGLCEQRAVCKSSKYCKKHVQTDLTETDPYITNEDVIHKHTGYVIRVKRTQRKQYKSKIKTYAIFICGPDPLPNPDD